MIQHWLSGFKLDSFNKYFKEGGANKILNNVQQALKQVANVFFLLSSVANQKQYLWHNLKKPNKMTTWELAMRLEHINKWFDNFPADNDDPEQPFNKLGDDEIQEIYHWVLPSTWGQKMEKNVQLNWMTTGSCGVVNMRRD